MSKFLEKYFTNKEISQLKNQPPEQRAFGLVKKVFENRTGAAGEPYIGHLERVAVNAPDEYKTAAYLHDILEDNDDCSVDDLRELDFDDNTIAIVELLTKPKDLAYLDYVDRIINSGNKGALLVKYTDASRTNILSKEQIEHFKAKYSVPKAKIIKELER